MELGTPPAWIDLTARLTRRLPIARGRVADWIGRNSNQRFLAKMPAELGGYAFDCPLRDIVARHVFLTGAFAHHEVAYMRATLKPGMRFVDVGAHWGLLTLLATHLVGETGRAIALEPDPRMLARLNFNLELNHIPNVHVLEVAAADRNSELVLAGYPAEAGDWTASRLTDAPASGPTAFRVQGRRLDDVLDEVGEREIDLVKIDVEGAEGMVLRGMEKGLTQQRYKRVLLELHPEELEKRSQRVAEVAELLTSKGYSGYRLDRSSAQRRRAYYHPWQPLAKVLPRFAPSADKDDAHTVWVSTGTPLFDAE